MDTEEGVEVIIFILGRGSELVYQHSGMYSRGRVSRPTEERRRVNGSRRWGGRALEGGKAVEMRSAGQQRSEGDRAGVGEGGREQRRGKSRKEWRVDASMTAGNCSNSNINHEQHTVKSLHALREDEHFCDVTLVCEDKQIEAHKVLHEILQGLHVAHFDNLQAKEEMRVFRICATKGVHNTHPFLCANPGLAWRAESCVPPTAGFHRQKSHHRNTHLPSGHGLISLCAAYDEHFQHVYDHAMQPQVLASYFHVQ